MSESFTGEGERRAVASLLAHPRYEVAPTPGVLEHAGELPIGATVAVTASPRRGVGATVDLAVLLAARGFRTVPHLAARSIHDRAQLSEILARLAEAGVRDVFVVGGDAREPVGRFSDGLDLLRAIDEVGRPPRVGVPSYPDGHHRIDTETLWSALEAKQALADYTVTQMCFDADVVCRFVVAARHRGIDLPIVAGVPGVVDTGKLLRIGVRIGVGDSIRFVRANRSMAETLLRAGSYQPDAFVRALGVHVRDGDCEIDGVHVYTFNQVAATVRWLTEAHQDAAA